jgi:ABC-type dipeptide/oligopeptide/nickel transport system permease component
MAGSRVQKRILSTFWILIAVFVGSRAMILALPGSPLETLLAETGTSVPKEQLERELGLDRPFWVSLASDAKGALHGDFGRSILTRTAVGPEVAQRLRATLHLASSTLTLTLILSLGLGLAAAWPHPNLASRSADWLCTLHGGLSAALPTPWFGPILAWILAVRWPVFPLGNHLALPTLTLALALSGFWARIIRERVRETLTLGAARAARARGLSEKLILLKYGLAPASPALLAFLGTQAGSLMAGAFIAEVIFEWPGLGSLLVDSVLKRDYPLVQASVFVAASISLLGSLVGDLLQTWIDPREQLP